MAIALTTALATAAGQDTAARDRYPHGVADKVDVARKRAEYNDRQQGGEPTSSTKSSSLGASVNETSPLRAGSVIDAIRPIWVREMKPRPSLQPLQEWEGYVLSVGATTFTARLVDVTAGQSIELEATDFLIDDLNEYGRSLLREGAIFRWVIGYLKEPNGVRRRVSEIVFRRLPAWTASEIRAARRNAETLVNSIAWE